MAKVFVLLGKAGAGKTLVATRLSQKLGIRKIKNTTTRPRRSELDREYNFTTNDSFTKDDGRYIAVRRYKTLIEDRPKYHYYGVDRLEIEKGGLLITDFEGFKELLERNLDVVGIYLYSSPETRYARSAQRDGFKLEEFTRRAEDDDLKFKLEEIIEVGKTHPVYIVENNLSTSVDEVCDKVQVIIDNYK